MNQCFPDTGAHLLQQTPEVLRRWEHSVRAVIPASREQQRLVLQNNLEPLLAEVPKLLASTSAPRVLVEGHTLSEDHGGQRAVLPEYAVGDVLVEYRILRETILEVLGEETPLSAPEREAISGALERAMQEAVSQYTRVTQELLRQHLAEATRRVADLQAAYDRESRIAQVLQRPLHQSVAEDAVAGLSLATCYEPARDEAEVGGDFFAVLPLAVGQVALVVGDACGQGVEVALHNTLVKDVLGAFLRETPQQPGAVLARVNRVLYDTLGMEVGERRNEFFVALALLVLDPLSGEGLAASAGGEPLLIVRSGGAAQVVEQSGLPLGIEPEARYADTPVRLEPGDTALLVTDGIPEARRGSNFLGYPRMVTLAQEALQAPSLPEAAQALMTAVYAHAGGALADDACLLLARRR